MFACFWGNRSGFAPGGGLREQVKVCQQVFPEGWGCPSVSGPRARVPPAAPAWLWVQAALRGLLAERSRTGGGGVSWALACHPPRAPLPRGTRATSPTLGGTLSHTLGFGDWL